MFSVEVNLSKQLFHDYMHFPLKHVSVRFIF